MAFGASSESTVRFTPSELADQTKEAPLSSFDNIEKEFSQSERPEFQHTFFKMLLLLGAIIVLSFITLWSFKRLTRNRVDALNTRKSIKILEKRILSPKSILYLVEYEGKKALISESHLDMKIKFID